MDWSSIKYIFQIPVSWYEKIHDRVFNAYGVNFIRVKDGDWYGGMEIGVDEDAFQQAVDRSLEGVVRTVNNTAPDGNGNVDVGTVKYVNNTAPDENGNVAITIPQQTVTSVDHHSPDQNGNIQLNAICTINGHNGDSVGNFAGVVTSINGNTPTDGAVTMTVVESVDGVSPVNGDVVLNAVKSVNNTSPDANGNVDIDTVTSVDGHQPDSNGAVSFGLTASKWVKTNSSGHLTTTNDNVVTIASNQTGQSYSLDFVTDVTWNGTTLQKKMRRLVFSNGVLTNVLTETTSTIDTPVPYTTA